MNTQWRIRAVGLSAVAAMALAACGGGGQAEDAKSVEVWFPTPFGALSANEEEAIWTEIFAPFEEANDVKVNLTLVPWASYEEKYLTGVSSGSGPDLGYMYTEMMGDYIANGALASFDNLSSDFTSQMMYLDQGKVGGEQYALPFVVGGIRMLYGNTDILSAAGIPDMPTTWEEFLADSLTVKNSGQTAIQQDWGNPARGMMNGAFFPTLWQAGGEILSEDGSKTAFDSPEGLAAANFLMDQLAQGTMPDNVSGMSQDEVKEAFLNGETAFFNGADATHAELDEAGINYDFVPFLTGKTGGTFVASDAVVMLDACPDKALCGSLAEFVLSGDQMTQIHTKLVPYPPIGLDEKVDASDPFIAVYLDNADFLHSLPVAAGSAGVYNSLYTNMQQMIMGQKTPEQALKDAAAEGDAALKEAQE